MAGSMRSVYRTYLGDFTNSGQKPRTAIGWTSDRQLLLFVADGSSSRSRAFS